MKEHFTITIPNSYNYSYLVNIIICYIIAFIVVYPILGFGSTESIVSIILLFFIIYVIVNSMTNTNLSNELPSTIYPYNPNLGLDGISLNSYVAGMSVNRYIV
jgi:hypothetical protein